MNRKYNFETPERVIYGGPLVSFVTAIFLFRAATGLGLFEAKTFVEANMNMNDQREVNTRELGEMIKAWWDEKGIPKRYKDAEDKALAESRRISLSLHQQEASWANIGPEDKVSQIQDEEAHKKEISVRQDGWIDPGSISKEAWDRVNKF